MVAVILDVNQTKFRRFIVTPFRYKITGLRLQTHYFSILYSGIGTVLGSEKIWKKFKNQLIKLTNGFPTYYIDDIVLYLLHELRTWPTNDTGSGVTDTAPPFAEQSSYS